MAFTGSSGETTCSSKGETSDSTSVGKVPLQVGPAARVPVQTSMPESGMVVEPVGFPPVTMVAGPDIIDDGFSAM